MNKYIRVLLVGAASILLVTACSESPTATATLDAMSITVASVPSDIPSYNRDNWRHWEDEDRDCQDTRQEVLVEESVSPVEYEDSDQCRVKSGEWNGPYTGEQFTNPRDLDVDHMVPLANAHRSGGWLWGESRRREYANDLSYAGHLIAVQNSANRAKGANGPEEWKPPDQGYWCQYAIDWITIKNSWKLTATEAEATSLSEMLNSCTPKMTLTTVELEAPRPDAILTATSTSTPTSVTAPVVTSAPPSSSEAIYDSCDESEAADEPRVLGIAGDGWGFPKAKVPSARDGDGDGVVCEESRPSTSTPDAITDASSATPTPAPQPTDTSTPNQESVTVYESCDAAEEAGETRSQGDEGTGWGFPTSMVPGARDGDGDGIVCEKSGPSTSASVTNVSDPTATPTPAPLSTDTPTPASQAVYESCNAAEAAGEMRVRGSSGEGRGFPAAMVPSARDGDGDGVVCER